MGSKRINKGYYRYATIFEDKIYFVCEDDIWATTIDGGRAHRLTNGQGESSFPRVSPDGEKIAFVGREEGRPEIFVTDASGGLPKRVTYLDANRLTTTGWSYDGRHIYFVSDHNSAFIKACDGFAVSSQGGEPECFQWGHVQSFDIQSDGRVVIGRNNQDPARWKRYKGGTKGDIWIDDNGDGKFKRLIELEGNLVWPMWIDSRVYFLSDHEGIGNIYSVKPNGTDLERHTNQSEYFVRFPSTDGERITYTAGGDIYVYDPQVQEERKIEVIAPQSTYQIRRKFVQAKDHIEHFSPHPEGHSLALVSRGQPLTMGNWEGPGLQHGVGSRVRYRLCEWMPDGESFVVVNDKDGFEKLELHYTDQSKDPTFLTDEDFGRFVSIKVSFDGKKICFSNHKQELWLFDLKSKNLKLVDKSTAERITDFNWSYDSRWIAYSFAIQPQFFIIKIASSSTGKTQEVTDPVRCDVAPSWDPEGKYLYFLGARDFYPVMDAMSFDYGFPRGFRPYLLTLRKDVLSPLVKEPKPVVKKKSDSKMANELLDLDVDEIAAGKKGSSKDLKKVFKRVLKEAYDELSKEVDSELSGRSSRKDKDGEKDSTREVKIDFDGIKNRILSIPVSEGRYGDIVGVKGRVLFTLYPVKGIKPDHSWFDRDRLKASLIAYDFDDERSGVLAKEVNEIKLAYDSQTLFARSGKSIAVLDALESLPKNGKSQSKPLTGEASRDSGIVDLSRAQILVTPQDEWSQMYDEAWRLQSEQFWDETMSDIDWDLVYDRYARLLPRLRTRSEVSDLIWEMQGELGTSHAYEIGGDYRKSPHFKQGYLGADFKWDGKSKGYKIQKIYQGDSWQSQFSSPLSKPGIGVEVGDTILAINGHKLARYVTVSELLINHARQEVNLTIKGKGKKSRTITVQPLSHEAPLRYRNWVEENRAFVHSKTKGKIGYIHIPDMGPFGFAEFHRSYLSEVHREGLIIDVRYNGGGHVSSLLLEKLARRRVGYDVSRWGPPQPYPQESVAGPMVAITNEFAGSDGDIFSHCFKLFELGPLVGKRTWGGVIGIWPKLKLVDGTITTQPEYSFWFMDVGYGVENYGTDPDFEVDIAPHQFRKGEDPQMLKALNLVLQEIKAKPFSLPDFSERPRLTLPSPESLIFERAEEISPERNGDDKNGSEKAIENKSKKGTKKKKSVTKKKKTSKG